MSNRLRRSRAKLFAKLFLEKALKGLVDMGISRAARAVWGGFKTYGLSLIIFAAIIVMVWAGLGNTASMSRTEERRMLEDNIWRAVVSCYAVEGSYPESLDYLKENYGLRVDDNKFIVHYDIFASNIMPDIDILER